MDYSTEADQSPETDTRPLAYAEKCKLSKLMLRIAGDEWASPGSFLRSHLHRLDRAIRNADVQADKARKQRAARQTELKS
jgi:hypothetical protein